MEKSVDLIATRPFERGELRVDAGERFTVEKEVADHLIKVAEVARRVTAEDGAVPVETSTP